MSRKIKQIMRQATSQANAAKQKKIQAPLVTKMLCGRRVTGYENVKCAKCGDNIRFYVGDAPPVCAECQHIKLTGCASHIPVPPEIRRYNG